STDPPSMDCLFHKEVHDSSSDGTTEVIQDEPDPWPTPPTGKKTALTLSKNITKLNDKICKEERKNPISAVNLTKMNLTDEVAREILQGKYSFIYLRPSNAKAISAVFLDEAKPNQ
ncbi:hypothetical protein PSTT_05360, partial [Puccinia striiformis]